jgi:hypothetical protein
MAGLTITVKAGDSILSRYGNQLAAIGEGLANTVIARSLNHEGDKGRTQVKRVLVRQTGINYNMVEKGMATHKAHAGKLSYELLQRGSETNLGLFQARQGASGVSAAPWNVRRIFRGDNPSRGSFFLPGTRLVFIRTGKHSYPIEPLFGPNLAREIVKDESAHAWRSTLPSLANRVGHELARVLPH